jgi:hypothetical protein
VGSSPTNANGRRSLRRVRLPDGISDLRSRAPVVRPNITTTLANATLKLTGRYGFVHASRALSFESFAVELGVTQRSTDRVGDIAVMKGSLLRRWIEFVRKYSKWRVWPYSCLIVTLALAVLEFTKYAHVHFLLIMIVVTIMAFERLAFTELLADKDIEIERLKGRT